MYVWHFTHIVKISSTLLLLSASRWITFLMNIFCNKLLATLLHLFKNKPSFLSFVTLDTVEGRIEQIFLGMRDDYSEGWDNISN